MSRRSVRGPIQLPDGTDVGPGNPLPVDATITAPVGGLEVIQDTHDDLNANANLQVGDVDVANGNPVPISDAGGSLTVDGTVAISGTPTVIVTQPVSIDDNGGSLTVDGTVAVSNFPATQPVSGTVAVSNFPASQTVDDGGGSLTVDGSVSVTGDVDLAPSHTRNEAFKEAVAIGGELDDTATVAATEGNVSPARITAQRALHANLRKADGTELGTASDPVRTDPTGTTTQPVSDGGGSLTVDGAVTVTQAGDVEVVQPTHDDLNANANIQVGNTDVANGNPVPVSDAGGSLTVDGTIAVSNFPAVQSIDDNGGSLTVDGTVTTNPSGDHEVVQPTHDDLNANANIQVGNTDVANGNPVPVSDAGGSLTVDGFAAGSAAHVQLDSEVDSNNSSTALLGIGGTFTGTGTDVRQFGSVQVLVQSDVPSGPDGVQFQFSPDNTNWSTVARVEYEAHSGWTIPVLGQFFRILYDNGLTAQSSFRLETILCPATAGPPLVAFDPQASMDPNKDHLAVLTRGKVMGMEGTNPTDIAATAGALNTHVSSGSNNAAAPVCVVPRWNKRIDEQNVYMLSYATSLGPFGVFDLYIDMQGVDISAKFYVATEGMASAVLKNACSIDVAGTSKQAYNRNRNGSDTPATLFESGGVYTKGTSIWEELYPPFGQYSERLGEQPIVLNDADGDYVFELTNLSPSATILFSVNIVFFE